MTRRELVASPLLYQTAARRPPNVVLILTDDQGYGDFSFHGNPHVRTPNVDRLASQSAEFTRLTVSSVCAPTRASLLTGRYALRCGVHGVTQGRETMRRGEVTLGKALQGAGYRTALVGKWHLGENYPYVPHASGFDEFVGFRLGHWNRYFDSPTERNGTPARLSGYVSDALTDEALRFIGANRERPFFVYLAYNAPHSPYQVPDEYFNRFHGKGFDPELAAIYCMVENLDANIGRLMTRLDEWRLSNDTIVMFACDNGPQTDRYNNGFRARKGSVYEGGTRSPFLIRWPGKITAGRKVAAIAAHIDVVPTVLDLCGLKAPPGPPVDGVSLLGVLEGRAAAPRMIFSHADHQPDPLRPFPGAVREQKWKMVNGGELYDLESDPGEQKNLAALHPDELKRLNAAYEKWFASVTQGFRPGHPPIPVGYREENPAVLSAPQARLEAGLAFHARNGFANDFIEGWDRPQARASWEIEVFGGGRYEVWVQYLCGKAPAKVAASVGGESVEGEVQEATSLDPNVLPERSPHSSAAPDMRWARLRLGRLPIEPGVRTIEVRGALTYLKAVELLRVR